MVGALYCCSSLKLFWKYLLYQLMMDIHFLETPWVRYSLASRCFRERVDNFETVKTVSKPLLKRNEPPQFNVSTPAFAHTCIFEAIIRLSKFNVQCNCMYCKHCVVLCFMYCVVCMMQYVLCSMYCVVYIVLYVCCVAVAAEIQRLSHNTNPYIRCLARKLKDTFIL